MRGGNGIVTKYFLAVLAAAAAVLAGIWLPGVLLKERCAADFNKTKSAPSEYYNAAGFALSLNISEQMDVYDRLRMVSGSWESSFEEASLYEMNAHMHQAAEAARKEAVELFDRGLYPSNLNSEYGNWFSWKAMPFKAVDSVFNTYTAYYWKVIFQSIDSEERHTVYILDDGTLIAVEAYIPGVDFSHSIADVHTVKLKSEAVYTSRPTNGLDPREWTALPDLDVEGMEWKDMVMIVSDNFKSLYAAQLYSEGRYIFFIKV